MAHFPFFFVKNASSQNADVGHSVALETLVPFVVMDAAAHVCLGCCLSSWNMCARLSCFFFVELSTRFRGSGSGASGLIKTLISSCF